MDLLIKTDVLLLTRDTTLATTFTSSLPALGYAVVAPATTVAELAALWPPAATPVVLLLDLDQLAAAALPTLAPLLAGPRLVQVVLLSSAATPVLPEAGLQLVLPGWLRKPADALALAEALSRAQLTLARRRHLASKSRRAKPILVSGGARYHLLPLQEVQCLEVDDKYVTAVTATTRYTLRTSMKELLLELPSKQFVRIHTSWAINLKYLTGLEKDGSCVMLPIGKLPVGRSYLDDLRSRLLTL